MSRGRKATRCCSSSVLGFCFGFCLLVVKLDYSIALGAFLIGAIMAESRHLHRIEHLIAPLRDTFSAIFFVTIGLMLNPAVLVDYAWPIAVITVAVIVGKIVSCGLGTFLAGKDGRTAMRVGMTRVADRRVLVHHRLARADAEGDERVSVSDCGGRFRADHALHAVPDPRRRSAHPAPRRVDAARRSPTCSACTRSGSRSLRPATGGPTLFSMTRRIVLQIAVNLALVVAIFLARDLRCAVRERVA